jgi:hypothetical protein
MAAEKKTFINFLTQGEMKLAIHLRRTTNGAFRQECIDKVVKPAYNRITKNLGKQYSPEFLAYYIEHIVDDLLGPPPKPRRR